MTSDFFQEIEENKPKTPLREQLQSLKDDADLNLPPKVYEEVLQNLRFKASLGQNHSTISCLYSDYIANKLRRDGLDVFYEEAENVITIYWGPPKEEVYINEK